MPLFSRILYPALFEPSGIAFDLPGEAVVTLTIHDASGEIVAEPLKCRRLEQGAHEILFPSPGNRTGGLFYKIIAVMGEETVTESRRFR